MDSISLQYESHMTETHREPSQANTIAARRRPRRLGYHSCLLIGRQIGIKGIKETTSKLEIYDIGFLEAMRDVLQLNSLETG